MFCCIVVVLEQYMRDVQSFTNSLTHSPTPHHNTPHTQHYGHGSLLAPMPGRITRVLVSVGQSVKVCCLLWSMSLPSSRFYSSILVLLLCFT